MTPLKGSYYQCELFCPVFCHLFLQLYILYFIIEYNMARRKQKHTNYKSPSTKKWLNKKTQNLEPVGKTKGNFRTYL